MRIAGEGWPFILGVGGTGLLILVASKFTHTPWTGILGVLILVLASFCGYFFRDPVRQIPAGNQYVLSPADGRVLEVKDGVVRIFLSVFDVHIQRSPTAGSIGAIRYKAGKFLDARDPRAAFENEQNRIEIVATPLGSDPKGSDPDVLVVTQIAGLIARRIACWVKEGQKVQAGERLGLIRFGSQVDVELPKSSRVRVHAGDRVVGGETILAEKR